MCGLVKSSFSASTVNPSVSYSWRRASSEDPTRDATTSMSTTVPVGAVNVKKSTSPVGSMTPPITSPKTTAFAVALELLGSDSWTSGGGTVSRSIAYW